MMFDYNYTRVHLFSIESWKESPDFYQYLSKLGGYDVDQLSKSVYYASRFYFTQ